VDIDLNPVPDLLAEALIENFHPTRVLDVGCGGGELVHAFQTRDVIAYGIDTSPKVERWKGGVFIQANGESLPFKDCGFDLVTAHHVIEHLKDPDSFINEAKRVLKSKGVVYITTPISPFGLTGLWRILQLQREPTHISLHTRSFWLRAFESHGFKFIGNLQGIIVKDPPVFWVGRLLTKLGLPGK